jgi:hypothetical protein
VIRVFDRAGSVIEAPGNVIATQEHATGASRRFEFQKRSQLLICTNNETLSVAAIGVRNEDCLRWSKRKCSP